MARRVGHGEAYRAPQLDFMVDKGDIGLAIPKDSSHCMIADALRRAYPDAQSVSVDLATIRFTDALAGLRYIYLTPAPAQLALLAFDKGEPVTPFRVRASAAQIVLTGAARKSRRAQAVAQGRDRAPRQSAKVQGGDASNGVPGVKMGGTAPPTGPLATGRGATQQQQSGQVYRGKRREYGLRALIQ